MFPGGGLRMLRAALGAALLAAPLSLTAVAPLAADTTQAPGLLLAPDVPAFGPVRRAQLARNALYFVPGDDESPDEDDVFTLPAPLPWPPGANDRTRTLTVPAGRPLFLLAALAPGNDGFNGPPTIFVDGASLGNVLPYAVRGVSVSDGARQQEHAALALVLAPPEPGRHTVELTCGVCAPTRGQWLSSVNGGKRTYLLDVQAPTPVSAPATPVAAPVTEPPLAEPALVEARAISLLLDADLGYPIVPVVPRPAAPPPPVNVAVTTPPVPATPSSVALERTVYSNALGRELPYRVYLPAGYTPSRPQDADAAAQPAPETLKRYPVLYLLHGLGAGFRMWSRLGLEAELDRQGVQAIVVTPSGRAGYWVNHADGGPRWGDYVVEDLIGHVDATYRTIPRREARAIGGISMGGHGALQLALNGPTLFGAVGAHSPALRARDQAPVFLGGLMMAASPTAMPLQAYAARDPISLVMRAEQKLPIWIDIGEADRWRARADELRSALTAKSWDFLWSIAPGDHEDAYWSRRLPEYVRWYKERLGA
ncbi:MAG TPA: alpha/beta hydrolase-fold protein [Chloroflexota bacterium]|nr:alpha/beta hydrolase-fold protein [Chloroflexota bacterium]